MAASVRVVGAESVRRNLLVAPKVYRDALLAALYTEGLGLIAATDRFVPAVTGRLRDSHYVRPVRGYAGKDPWVKCSYAAPYAAAVHERTDVVHPNGTAKFMDRGLAQIRSGFAGRVAAMVKAGVDRKWTVDQVASTVPRRPIRKESRAVSRARSGAFSAGESTRFDAGLFRALRKARRKSKVSKG